MIEWNAELTEPQEECFDYMVLGYGYKKIGEMMGVARGTVQNYAHRILKKADVPDRITLILKHNGLPSWMDDTNAKV